MSLSATANPTGQRRPNVSCAMGAILLAAGAFAVQAAGGFQRLSNSDGDSDSLLRLVEVRDLMAGQGWFDLMQYRLGLAGGLEMHWSRLVDLPIALLIRVFGLLPIEPATAEAAALVAWPFLLMVASLFLLMHAARALGGDEAVLPAGVLGVAALYQSGIFAPGAIDHHNVQLALTLGLAALLCRPGSLRAGAVAGVLAALMLAVGMEGLPVVAASGIAVALRFWWLGRTETPVAAGFGLGLAVASLAALFVTRAPSAWFVATCDAFSIAQSATGIVAGAGLAAVALTQRASATIAARSLSLAVLGCALAALVLAAFPQCLADPYAGLDPRLQRFWLAAVTEAQPIWSVVSSSPAQAAVFYVTPLLALAVLGWRLLRVGVDRAQVSLLLLLAATTLTSFWQVRGALFAVPLAVVVLAGWIAGFRRHVQVAGTPRATLAMAAAWVVSLNVLWGALAGLVEPAAQVAADASAGGDRRCYAQADYAQLAALPPTTVLAVSNLGSPILAHTPHRALAGPYHRNVAGNLAVLDALMGTDEEARAVVSRAGAVLIAHCPGNPESAVLAEWAPGSLVDRLNRGEVPDWLIPLDGNDSLRLFAIRP